MYECLNSSQFIWLLYLSLWENWSMSLPTKDITLIEFEIENTSGIRSKEGKVGIGKMEMIWSLFEFPLSTQSCTNQSAFAQPSFSVTVAGQAMLFLQKDLQIHIILRFWSSELTFYNVIIQTPKVWYLWPFTRLEQFNTQIAWMRNWCYD